MTRLRGASASDLTGVRTGALALCLLAFAACDIASSNASVWVENIGTELDADREWTYRITLHRFGDEIGGHVEFFRIDGACNSRTAPFFCAEDCAYFGPSIERGGEFRIRVTSPDDRPLIIQMHRDSRRQLTARVIDADAPDDTLEFPMIIDGVNRVTAQCPERAESFAPVNDAGLSTDL